MTSLGESAGPIGTRLTLTPGDQLVIPTDTPRAYRNDGTVPAAVLAVQVYPDAPQGSPFPPGVVVDPLATGLLPAPSAPLTVVLDRVVVPRGGAVSPRTPPAPEIVYVETGTLQATVEGAPAEIQRGPVAVATGAESGMTGNGDHVLPPGFGLFAEPGATMTLRNTADDPLTLLVLTVAPAGDATPVVTLSGP